MAQKKKSRKMNEESDYEVTEKARRFYNDLFGSLDQPQAKPIITLPKDGRYTDEYRKMTLGLV